MEETNALFMCGEDRIQNQLDGIVRSKTHMLNVNLIKSVPLQLSHFFKLLVDARLISSLDDSGIFLHFNARITKFAL